MIDDETPVASVYSCGDEVEASRIAQFLENCGVTSEWRATRAKGAGLSVRVVVHRDRAEDAVRLLEEHLENAGLTPTEAVEPDVSGPCPNCEKEASLAARECGGCGFGFERAPAAGFKTVRSEAPDSRSFCPECRGPVTMDKGVCSDCGEVFEPLEKNDRLCPASLHVLFRDTKGGDVCLVCEKVWLER